MSESKRDDAGGEKGDGQMNSRGGSGGGGGGGGGGGRSGAADGGGGAGTAVAGPGGENSKGVAGGKDGQHQYGADAAEGRGGDEESKLGGAAGGGPGGGGGGGGSGGGGTGSVAPALPVMPSRPDVPAVPVEPVLPVTPALPVFLADLTRAKTTEDVMEVLRRILAAPCVLMKEDSKKIFVRASMAVKKRVGRAVWSRKVGNQFGLCLRKVRKLRAREAFTGANINLFDNHGCTQLYTASMDGRVAVVSNLLEAGANVDLGKHYIGVTPLRVAALKGHVDVVATLLEAGANVDLHAKGGWGSGRDFAQIKGGLTPLMCGALSGKRDIVEMLLKAGADAAVRSTGTYYKEHPAGSTAREIAERKTGEQWGDAFWQVLPPPPPPLRATNSADKVLSRARYRLPQSPPRSCPRLRCGRRV
eukprot:g2922.t1